jgi:hypothetical protein
MMIVWTKAGIRISGSRGNKKEHCTRWERVISDIRPHHLVFHAGGNDLEQNSCEGFTEEMVFVGYTVFHIPEIPLYNRRMGFQFSF